MFLNTGLDPFVSLEGKRILIISEEAIEAFVEACPAYHFQSFASMTDCGPVLGHLVTKLNH